MTLAVSPKMAPLTLRRDEAESAMKREGLRRATRKYIAGWRGRRSVRCVFARLDSYRPASCHDTTNEAPIMQYSMKCPMFPDRFRQVPASSAIRRDSRMWFRVKICVCFTAVLTVAASGVWSADAGHEAEAAPIACDRLRCEYRVDPLGVDVPRPRLSWILLSGERAQRQTAYHIQVAGDLDKLKSGQAELWDSGRVMSDRSIQVVYAGKPLQPRQRCYWRVKVWDRDGASSAWSEPAMWEMGLLNADQWAARWIGDGQPTPERDADFYDDDPAPLFRKSFVLKHPIRQARLYITGLGYFRAVLNGRDVHDQRLMPLWTDYRDRVFYSVCDVADQLTAGENVIGVTLGNGWYNPLPLRMWGRINLREFLPTGRPCFIAQLEITHEDGSRTIITSDQTWLTAPGPVVRNNIYLGEHYDARREVDGWDAPGFDATNWREAAEAQSPGGRLIANFAPPIREGTPFAPKRISEPKPGVYAIDFGRNFTGTLRMRVRGQAGQTVKLRYGELLNMDGTVNVMTSVCGQIKRDGVGGPGAPEVAEQSDTYILRGDGPETYVPRFTFHGFRYAQISGYPGKPKLEDFIAIPLGCDVERVGRFACSNPLYNDIEAMVRQTFESNLMGVQSDCPHRERFGYGGDIVVTAEAFMLNYDMAAFYAKSVYDFADSVRSNGGLTETAPHAGPSAGGFGESSGPIGWGLAHPLLLRQLYRYYGDQRLIEEQYEVARRWLELIRSTAPEHIVSRGIGDHESVEHAPRSLTGTAFYFHTARLLSELADLLGKDEDAGQYAQLAQNIRMRFLEEFYDAQTGRLKSETQAAHAVALYYGLTAPNADGEVMMQLAERLSEQEHRLTTGIFGTRYLLDVLSEYNRGDLAHRVVDHREWPGWGYMLENGATTLWEHWKFSDNTFSHNHPMFGSISEWMIRHVAGLTPAPDAVGCDRWIIRPRLIDQLQWADGRYDSIRGEVACRWERSDGKLSMRVTLPVGTSARLFMPAADVAQVRESGRPAADSPGCRLIGSGGGAVEFQLGSGEYHFTAPYSPR